MHLMLIMEMIVIMKVIMKVVKMKRSHILSDLKTLVLPLKKINQDSLKQAYIALWEDKIVQLYIRLLFGWIKRLSLWI